MIRHLRDAALFLLPITLAALVLWVICEALRPPDPLSHGARCQYPFCPLRQAHQEASWWDSRGGVD